MGKLVSMEFAGFDAQPAQARIRLQIATVYCIMSWNIAGLCLRKRSSSNSRDELVLGDSAHVESLSRGGKLVWQESDRENKPIFFYGYVIVLVSLIVMTLTFGVNYSFGIFFEPLSNEFNWSKSVTSAGYSIGTIISGFLGMFAGRLTDRLGAKTTSIAGGLFLGLGCILMSQVHSVWQFYLIYGLIVSAGIGGAWPSLTATIPRWFLKRRGLMIGIVASGIGIGQTLLPPLISRSIPVYGWRTSYVILGVLTLVIVVIASLFLRSDPHLRGQLIYGETQPHSPDAQARIAKQVPIRDMVRSRPFWMVSVIYFFFGFGLHTVTVHIVPYAILTGTTAQTAATIVAVIGGASVASRLLIGAISSKIGVKTCLVAGFILFTLVFTGLPLIDGLWWLYLFAFVFGASYGGVMTLQAVLSADLFGLKSLGLILGSVSFIYTLGSAAGPFVSGLIFDITSSYRLAFFLCASFGAMALIVLTTSIKTGRVSVLGADQNI
jgi:MFS transporter, OFA family, oxalate/formate antiporter